MGEKYQRLCSLGRGNILSLLIEKQQINHQSADHERHHQQNQENDLLLHVYNLYLAIVFLFMLHIPLIKSV